jgi:hypothetical protein
LQVRLRHFHETNVPHLQISQGALSPKELSYSSFDQQLLDKQGEEPILCLSIPNSKEDISIALGVDMRNSLIIAIDRKIAFGLERICFKEGEFIDE